MMPERLVRVQAPAYPARRRCPDNAVSCDAFTGQTPKIIIARPELVVRCTLQVQDIIAEPHGRDCPVTGDKLGMGVVPLAMPTNDDPPSVRQAVKQDIRVVHQRNINAMHQRLSIKQADPCPRVIRHIKSVLSAILVARRLMQRPHIAIRPHDTQLPVKRDGVSQRMPARRRLWHRCMPGKGDRFHHDTLNDDTQTTVQ